MAVHHGNEQALRQGGQIEAPVEPVGKRGQVAGRILGEGKGVVSPAQTIGRASTITNADDAA